MFANQPTAICGFKIGGDLCFGSPEAHEFYANPELMAYTMNIVVVSITYRLNAFGFLALQALNEFGSITQTSGNYGFYDQIAALQWVKQNILYFGGNPDNVIITGQSSGGTSVFALLISPLATGLFNAAMSFSASPQLTKTLSQAVKDNEIFIQNSNCTNADNNQQLIYNCIMNLTTNQILNSGPWNVYPYWSMQFFFDFPTPNLFAGGLAIIDGILIIDNLFDSLQNANILNNVPTIIGTTAQELDLEPSFILTSYTKSQFLDYINTRFNVFDSTGKLSSNIIDSYSNNIWANMSIQQAAETIATDIRTTCGNNDVAISLAKLNPQVYRYVVNSGPCNPFPVLLWKARYAYHTIDVHLFFNESLYYNDGNDNNMNAMTNTFNLIIKDWIFNVGKLSNNINWPTVSSNSAYPETAIIGVDDKGNGYFEISADFRLNQCNIFKQAQLVPAYSWIN